ncbi:hypothetical protein OPV22_003127 [Ensete ventricosum]|uniref:Scarecrow-like protein 6 n=1 Tax=Ensete ventricosum TaxID=4639 RepID=A0AAV8RZZ5_ENSVE|nr:hypothetical protein OPV22_003127 [Ensete ventricosum]
MRGGMPFAVQEKGAPLQVLEGEEGLFWCASATAVANNNHKKRRGEEEGKEVSPLEPRSVLESLRSPSPPSSSASTVSSSRVVNGGGPASSDGSATPTPTPTPTTSAAAAEEARKDEGAAELPPVPTVFAAGEDCSLGGVDDWEALLSEPAASIGQDQTFLRWIIDEADNNSAARSNFTGLLFDPAFVLEGASASAEPASPPPMASSVLSTGVFGSKGATFGCTPCLAPRPTNSLLLSLPPLPPGVISQESTEERPLFGPSLFFAHQQQAQPPQRSSFFLPLNHFAGYQEGQPLEHLAPPPRKRLAVDPLPSSHVPDLFLRRNQPQQLGLPQQFNTAAIQLLPAPGKPKLANGDEASVAAAAAAAARQQEALVDQLFKAAEVLEAGNTVSARGILARLNHQLPSPVGKPLLRSAFYFKEALHLLANHSPHPHPPPSLPISTPLDVMLKLGAYKTFSDVSPIVQFASFTSIQPLLEALDGASRIHIIDFDIGVGMQWSAFMQELAQRWSSSMTAAPFLKITAFASAYSHHSLELNLIHQNLSHFASSINIPFEFSVLSLDPFDPAVLFRMCSAMDEAVAVNLPIGSAIRPPIPTLLRFVKQLSPKIVVSVDYGCDRIDLPFAHHILHAFQSCTVLLDSIDAAGANQDAANKIERFLVQPRIESAVLGRHHLSDKTLPWRTLFASAGFMHVQFSNFTETQAECLLKRVLVRGFHVEKRQSSLSLCWQRGELVSVSAWKC